MISDEDKIEQKEASVDVTKHLKQVDTGVKFL